MGRRKRSLEAQERATPHLRPPLTPLSPVRRLLHVDVPPLLREAVIALHEVARPRHSPRRSAVEVIHPEQELPHLLPQLRRGPARVHPPPQRSRVAQPPLGVEVRLPLVGCQRRRQRAAVPCGRGRGLIDELK